MAIKKLALISGSIVAVSIAAITGAGVVSAQSQTGQDNSLVNKIAQKFNLNKDDVQKVFTEDRVAHEAEKKANLVTHLDQAVKDGKITADQEAKLLAKLEEMQQARTDLKDKTEAEREAMRTAMNVKHTEFKAWLTTNNIPSDILPGHDKGSNRGLRGE